MIRRLAGIAVLLLILAPVLIVAVVTVLCAGVRWLLVGGEQDAILLNPVLGFIVDLPVAAGGWDI